MNHGELADDLAGAAVASAGGRRVVVLIDGRSGAGKTTLAGALATRLCGRLGLRVQLVSLDDCYPGWDGLAAASAMVPAMLRETGPGYRRYDWAVGRRTKWIALSGTDPLIVEGAGTLTPVTAGLASLAVWVDADPAVRQAAALARDGALFAPHWDTWAAQETAHLTADHPDQLADVVVTGLATSSGMALSSASQAAGVASDGISQPPRGLSD